MKSVLKKIKSDNKGNTLAIVLIGMLIVGVLGTVIIEASQVNLGMKVSNFKNKQNFYYVERAIDEIYAGIGQDVSKAMEDAYNASIKNVISKNSGTYSKAANLSTDFETSFKSTINGKYNTANAIKSIKYHLGIVDPGDTPNPAHPEKFYNDVGVSISVSAPAGLPVQWEKRKKDPSDPASSEFEILVIKDVLVKSTSNTNKYEASVKTDFEIEVPDIAFKFDDNPGNGLNSDFFEYALIADGKISDRKDAGAPDFNIHGAVNITGGSNVEVNGNIYAGDYHGDKPMGGGVNQRIDKDGIYVSDSTLTVNAANIVSKGAVRLEGSKTTVTFNGEAASSEKIGDLPLKLWTNDILLSGNEAKADINGNCFIKDDLEVNGNECSIDISGSYYGFGFESESGGLLDTSNPVVNEKRSGETPSLDSVTSTQREHEKRSAVIINGDGADVKLATDESSNRQFILGGRAYIDLTGKTGADSNSADYMTGESIALKGNQKIYLVDNPDPNGAIKSNPASIQELVNNSGLQKPFDSLTFYDYLKVNKNKVVAKRVGNGSDNDLIYFYHNTSDPIDQTHYAWEQINSPLKNGFDIINEAIGNMNIKNLYLGNSTVSYTAGTAIQIKDHNLITGNDTPYGENGIDAKEFKAIINNVGNRYKNIMYNLNDGSGADNSDSKMEEGSIPDKTGGSSNSPYDHFVDDGELNTLTLPRIAKQFKLNTASNAGITNQESDFPIPGDSVSAIKGTEFPDGIPKNQEIIIVFGNNREKGETINIDGSSSKSYGVIVCTGDVKIDRDFEGMIICGGNITITNNHKFKKNPELMKMLYNHSSFLSRVLKCESVTEVTPPTSGDFVKREEGFAFDSFVHIKNWRKNGED